MGGTGERLEAGLGQSRSTAPSPSLGTLSVSGCVLSRAPAFADQPLSLCLWWVQSLPGGPGSWPLITPLPPLWFFQTRVCACMLFLQSCLTVVILWTVAHQDPLSMGFARQEYWSGLPCPPLGDLPNPGIEPGSLTSPALAGGFFTTSTTWEAPG